MLGAIAAIAGIYMLITGSVPLRYGGGGPYSPWIRAAGAIFLAGIVFPMGWLGALFGSEGYGRAIVLVIGMVVLMIGMVHSLSRP